MVRRTLRVVMMLGCLLPAGCSSGGMSGRAASVLPAGPHVRGFESCSQLGQLTRGSVLPAWHLGAVQFLTVTSGVGITAESFPCFRPVTGGAEVGFQSQPARLATTSDGGLTWRVTGVTIPRARLGGTVGGEQIAALSPIVAWAVVGEGRLLATSDGGVRWTVQAVPAPVVQIAIENGTVLALGCPHSAGKAAGLVCHPELWRSHRVGGSWTRLPLPRLTILDPSAAHLAVTPDVVMVAMSTPRARSPGQLLITTDGGSHWIQHPTPMWDRMPCDNVAALTAQPPRTFWLLCLGGAAAGSSAKGLVRSTNGGATWSTMSAVASLMEPTRNGAIPRMEPSALAAGSRSRLWLSLTNGLAESDSAGRSWSEVPTAFDPGGWSTAIDVLDADHAWVLAAGAGLWRTLDGLHWHAVGSLHTG